MISLLLVDCNIGNDNERYSTLHDENEPMLERGEHYRSTHRRRGTSRGGLTGGTQSTLVGRSALSPRTNSPMDDSPVHPNMSSAHGSIAAPIGVSDKGSPANKLRPPANKLQIRPCANEFFPCETVNKISLIIKSKYDQPWSDWTNIPTDVKKMWFEEFNKHCTWDLEDHDEIVRIFKSKGAQILRQSLADIRRGKSSGRWMKKNVLMALQDKWRTDEQFKGMSERNKKNIAANKDGHVNNNGAISISERVRRCEIELGREVNIPELFERMNYDKEKEKSSTPRAESAYETYKKLKENKLSQGLKVDESTMFFEANGGINKKGRSCGFGSEVRFYSSRSGSMNRTRFAQANTAQIEELETRLGVVEQRNEELEMSLGEMRKQNQFLANKLNSVIGLLEKFTGASIPSSTDDLSPSNVHHIGKIDEKNVVVGEDLSDYDEGGVNDDEGDGNDDD